MGLASFYNDYEMPLARALHFVEQRGIAVDMAELGRFKNKLDRELQLTLAEASKLIGRLAVGSTEDAKYAGIDCVNLASPLQLLKLLEARGLKVPKSRKTGSKSTGADVLEKLFAESGDDCLRQILKFRELSKLKGTYADCKLLNGILYCSYVVTGTVTGRRSSRQNFLKLGANRQNLPKHSTLGMEFRKCLCARPGKILISADQMSAEDWIVHGLIADVSGIRDGLDELLSGANRHVKLASFIFSKPESLCDKTTTEGSMMYFLGKKTRYAGSYGMAGFRMSTALAAEGYHYEPKFCDFLLEQFHKKEPQIKGVFQHYVETELRTNRMLRTPLGRERMFFGLRPLTRNDDIFRDGYAYIPQSTVGDNTGMAILFLERTCPGLVIADDHDALTIETDDTEEAIRSAGALIERSFDREIKFPNGLTLKIPIEFEIGYNLGEMKACRDSSSLIGSRPICRISANSPAAQPSTTTGVPSAS
jgi:DNA polymerase-1